MSYKHLHECDTPMRAATRRKPTPGNYTVVVSCPPRTLHDHGDEVPESVKMAPTSERVIQIDFVGPKGYTRRSYHLEISEFVDNDVSMDLIRAEAEFSLSQGLDNCRYLDTIREAMLPGLISNLQDPRVPQAVNNPGENTNGI